MNQTANNGDAQSLLPISNGRFAMLLFLSTEVMFFAGLFASFVVLRSATPHGVWPQHEWVHVVFWLGLTNTLILTISSLTAWMALKAKENSKPGRGRILLVLTILLGAAFLGVKTYEYKTKVDLGIHPVAGKRQVFDHADIYYLAAVRKEVDRQMAILDSSKAAESEKTDTDSQADSNDSANSRLKEILRIRSGLVAWTESNLISINEPEKQQDLLNLFAQQIYHYLPEEHTALTSALAAEQTLLKIQLAELLRTYLGLSDDLEKLNLQITKLEDQQRKLKQQEKVAENPDEKNELAKQIVAITTPLSALKSDSSQLAKQASAQRQEMVPVENRIEFLENREHAFGGINQTNSPISLPLVIPGGGTWMNLYYLLTGLHAIHVLVGLVLFLGICLFGFRTSTSALHNCVLYWHFVDVVWLFMFFVIYL